MKLRYITIIFLLLIIVFICKQYSFHHLLDGDLVIKINNEKLDFKNETIKELSSFNYKKITVKNLSKGNIIINNTLIKRNKSNNIKINNLSDNNVLVIKTKNKKYFIRLIPGDFPILKKEGKSNFKENFLLSFNGPDSHYLIKTDYKGNVLAYKKTNELTYNFKRVAEKRYMYTIQIEGVFGGNNDSIYELVLLDEDFNEIDKIRYILDNNKKIGLDVHDFVYINDGHYIISSFQNKTVDNFPEEIYGKKSILVQDTLIEEIKDGKVLWEFKSSDYPKFYKYFNPEGVYGEKPTKDYYSNYMHFNSFAIDPNDKNLLASFRNINAIVKINRKNRKVMWILGGKGDEFGLKEEQFFLCQHSISFKDENTILLYDNGSQDRMARIVEIKTDQEKKKILDYKKHDLNFTTKNWGLVNYLGGDTYLINYGQIDHDDIYLTEEKSLKNDKVYFKLDTKSGSIYHTYKDRYEVNK